MVSGCPRAMDGNWSATVTCPFTFLRTPVPETFMATDPNLQPATHGHHGAAGLCKVNLSPNRVEFCEIKCKSRYPTICTGRLSR